MRMIGQAVRAVVVETMGVILVLWLIFGAAIWTFEREAPRSGLAPTWTETLALRGLLDKISAGVGESAARVPPAGVAERLDHYSDLYGNTVSRLLNQAADELMPRQAAPSGQHHGGGLSQARDPLLAPRT